MNNKSRTRHTNLPLGQEQNEQTQFVASRSKRKRAFLRQETKRSECKNNARFDREDPLSERLLALVVTVLSWFPSLGLEDIC